MMLIKSKAGLVAAALTVVVLVSCDAVAADRVTVTVDPSDVKVEISPNIYGLGIEDVNHEIYGCLDAQRLYGESFEEPPPDVVRSTTIEGRHNLSGCWQVKVSHPGEFKHDDDRPHSGRYSQLLVPNGAAAGMANEGLGNWGISIVKGRKMVGRLYARGDVGLLRISLESKDGRKTYAEREIVEMPGKEWTLVDFELVPNATDATARFAVTAYGYGKIWIDDAYLADEPTNAFGRIGCREDVVAGMQQAGINFLRWGGTMCNAEEYLLPTFGPDRKPYRGFWHRYSSGGFGPREFVRLAATMKVPCAVSISAREEVAEAVRFAEDLKAYDIPIVVEIGNEEMVGGCRHLAVHMQYCEHVRRLVEPMRKANPKLEFAGGSYWQQENLKVMEQVFRQLDGWIDYWDIHPFFREPSTAHKAASEWQQFLKTIRSWNPTTKMRAAVFEENGHIHTLDRALCHAIHLEAVRAAGRDVLTSCAVNGLQPYKQNHNCWDQGLVFLTPDKVWLSPYGWSQRMASDGHRELLVASSCAEKGVSLSAVRDRADRSLVLHFTNISGAAKAIDLSFADKTTWRIEKVVAMGGDELKADNGPDAPEKTAPVDVTAACRQDLALKPYSYTVVYLTK